MALESRTVSHMDERKLVEIRENVRRFLAQCGERFDRAGSRILDIAPQDHAGAKPHFPKSNVETFDINPDSGATYIGDLCATNPHVPADHFDYVACTEVLEHTLQPFDAVNELRRLMKPNGLVFVTTPFNFRIHGPLPDCWRFTEHGLRALFSAFELLELTPLEDKERFLMPTQYTLIARKPRSAAPAA